MGLFKFIEDMGEKIAGLSDKQLTAKLEKDMPDKIRKLDISCEDGAVVLKGECDSLADKEKAVLILGNIKGVKSVNADGLKVKEEEAKFYTIVKGDSLSKIAKAEYGDAKKWPVLFDANREVIKDEDLIYPGQVIRVPRIK